MKIIKTEIEGVLLFEPTVHTDNRGYFYESFSQRVFEQEVPEMRFVQDNQAYSRYGVLRGLHMQKAPVPQAKLVRAVVGEVLDVAVDFRPESPTYLQHVAVRLSAENNRQILVPHGFLHGYVVLSPESVVQYKVDNYYAPGLEFGLRFDDPALGIDWLLDPTQLIVSEKDKALGYLKR